MLKSIVLAIALTVYAAPLAQAGEFKSFDGNQTAYACATSKNGWKILKNDTEAVVGKLSKGECLEIQPTSANSGDNIGRFGLLTVIGKSGNLRLLRLNAAEVLAYGRLIGYY